MIFAGFTKLKENSNGRTRGPEPIIRPPSTVAESATGERVSSEGRVRARIS